MIRTDTPIIHATAIGTLKCAGSTVTRRKFNMPLVLTATVTCDSCGEMLEPERVVKQSEIDGLRWKWKRKAVAIESVRRPTKFYCPICADLP